MTRFHGGPANDRILNLQRSPKLLRVTQEGDNFDALDQPEDEPRPTEKIWLYERVGEPSFAFVDGSKFRGRCAIADYRFVTAQPPEEDLRDGKKWWAFNHKAT